MRKLRAKKGKVTCSRVIKPKKSFVFFLTCIVSYTHLFLRVHFTVFFFNLFLAVLGLRFCARAFSSCCERGPLFIAVCRPLTVVASLVVEHRLQTRRLSSCGSRAYLLRGMWDPPRPGLEPASPALAGRFSTTVPPGKPHFTVLTDTFTCVTAAQSRDRSFPLLQEVL